MNLSENARSAAKYCATIKYTRCVLQGNSQKQLIELKGRIKQDLHSELNLMFYVVSVVFQTSDDGSAMNRICFVIQIPYNGLLLY